MKVKQTIMVGLLGLFAGTVGGYIVTQLNHKAIKAEQFVLVDNTGKIHAILGLTNIDKPSLGLWDENGKNRIVIGFLSEGHPGIGLNDAHGNRRANLQLTTNDTPALMLFDKNGERIWSTP